MAGSLLITVELCETERVATRFQQLYLAPAGRRHANGSSTSRQAEWLQFGRTYSTRASPTTKNAVIDVHVVKSGFQPEKSPPTTL